MFIVRVLLTLMFLAVAFWGFFDFRGTTLVALLQDRLGISFRTAAFLVSLSAACLGGLAMLLWVVDHRSGRKKE